MDNNSEPFPLDFEALQKGDVLSREQIVKALGRPIVGERLTPFDEHRFRMLAMQLGGMIESERPDLVVGYHHDTIRILTDIEAEEATKRRCRSAVRSIGRNARRRAAIDRSEFSAEQLREAETNDRSITALALMTRKELARAQRELLLSGKAEDDDEDDDDPENEDS